MGKNKNSKQNKKKNNNNKKKEEAKEDRLDPTLPDERQDNDCVGSIGSDSAPLLSSSGDDTITVAVQGTEGLQNIKITRDALQRPGMGQDHPEWKHVEQWWDGQCAPLQRMVQEEMTEKKKPFSQAFVESFSRLQTFYADEFASVKAKMAETAREHGVKPLPSRVEKVVDPASLPDRKEVNLSGMNMKEFIAKWQKAQEQYPLSGKFNNLQVRHYSSAATESIANERAQKLVAAQQAREADAAAAKEADAAKAKDAAKASGPVAPPSTVAASVPGPVLGKRKKNKKNMEDEEDYSLRVGIWYDDVFVRHLCFGSLSPMSMLIDCELIREQVTAAITKRNRVAPKGFAYRYQGKNIRDTDTPLSLGMVHGDKIQVIEAPPTLRR